MLESKQEKPEHLLVTHLMTKIEVKDSDRRTLPRHSVMHFEQNVLETLLKNKVGLNSLDSIGVCFTLRG